ncbi:glycine zipper 2TM domain-containing protein [Pseudaminobacter sp. NGMCC 1.201702]|uniref:glycine zipper 2TM domain-containing protein n=1 Tax=Pseudaminobacter sp. NGMCC 1.201702 TaxID=3391825 RepID=UPI0039F07325
MKFRMAAVAVSALLAVSVAGCATSEQNQRAGTSALVGAGVGALAGQALGGNTKSTVAGAAGGALLGAAIGTATTPQRGGQDYCRYQRRDGSVYTAPCQDDRYYDRGGYYGGGGGGY